MLQMAGRIDKAGKREWQVNTRITGTFGKYWPCNQSMAKARTLLVFGGRAARPAIFRFFNSDAPDRAIAEHRLTADSR